MKQSALIRMMVILTTLYFSLFTSMAQTLNVRVGSVTYQFPATQCGEMTYTDGTSLTILNKTFTLSDITSMTIDQTEVTDNTVGVVYNGSSATVLVSGNIAQYITPTVSGAHVSIEQGDDVADEITYELSGSSSDGEFYMSGSYKATILLNGLTLTNVNPVISGAAIHIQNGKRINIKVVEGTNNTLTDAVSGNQTGCLYVKGHTEFKQKGTLNVVGKVKHAIKAGDYISVKNTTINVTSAVKDGISCNEYFLMESGSINISGVGDEGIQCELDGNISTGETTDHEDEDSGNIYIEGGSITVSTNGEGIESKGELYISGGELTINAKDDAVNSAGDLTISGGYIYARSTNNDGIDANGNCYIKGGLIYAIGSGAPEVAVDANSEERKQLYFSGGTLVAIGGLESGSSLTQSCYSASSWSQNSWYALYNGDDLALAFKTPSSGGNTLVVSTSGTTSLKSGVTVSGGKEYFDGMGNIGGSVSGGSSVSLSSYTGGDGFGGGGFPGGGGGPGGGGFPGGGWH